MSDVLNVRQAAELLGVHTNTVRNWTAAGKLTDVSPTALHARRFAREQVEQLAAALRVERQAKARAKRLLPRPTMVLCPVCNVETDPQPQTDDAEWFYICDNDHCPVSSFGLRWRTLQEQHVDALAAREANV